MCTSLQVILFSGLFKYIILMFLIFLFLFVVMSHPSCSNFNNIKYCLEYLYIYEVVLELYHVFNFFDQQNNSDEHIIFFINICLYVTARIF